MRSLTPKQLRSKINITLAEIEQLEKLRVQERDSLSADEREDLRQQILDLHSKYCSLRAQLESLSMAV